LKEAPKIMAGRTEASQDFDVVVHIGRKTNAPRLKKIELEVRAEVIADLLQALVTQLQSTNGN
jgi:hypothetical protein